MDMPIQGLEPATVDEDPLPPLPPKPGWQTTEFWLTLVAQIMPVLVLVHVIQAGDVQSLTGALNTVVQSIFALVISGGVIGKYIQSRTTVKAGKK